MSNNEMIERYGVHLDSYTMNGYTYLSVVDTEGNILFYAQLPSEYFNRPLVIQALQVMRIIHE